MSLTAALVSLTTIMAEINNTPSPKFHGRSSFFYLLLSIAYLVSYMLFVGNLMVVVNWNLMWGLGVVLLPSMIFSLINWLPKVVPDKERWQFVLIDLPIVAVEALIFYSFHDSNSDQFIEIFAYGNISLLLSATLDSNKDRLTWLVPQFGCYAMDYFLLFPDVSKALWMLVVFIIGLFLQFNSAYVVPPSTSPTAGALLEAFDLA